MTTLVLVICLVIWRLTYIYRKQKADLSKAVLKIGENQIDNEINALPLRDLINHANQRNSEPTNNENAKPDGSTSGGDNPK